MKKYNLKFRILLILAVAAIFSFDFAGATEYTSSSFKVLDPVVDIAAGPRAATTSYALLTAVGQPAIGRSVSTTFGLLSGFLYFSDPIAPSIGPVCGDGTCNGSETCSGCSADCGVCPSPTGGGLLEPPITYFPPIIPFPPPLIPPFIPPIVPLPPPVIPPGCVPGESGISRADLNCDTRVNLTDFSIFMYFLSRPIEFSKLADISKDENVDLVDLSVMFSEWTERAVAFVNGNDVYETGRKDEKTTGLDRLKDIFAKGKGVLESMREGFSEDKYRSVAVAGVGRGQEPLPAASKGYWPLILFGALAMLAVIVLAVRFRLKF